MNGTADADQPHPTSPGDDGGGGPGPGIAAGTRPPDASAVARSRRDAYRTRRTLLERIGRRDEHGWIEFYALYSPLVAWLCRRQGIRSNEVQQLVVQAVMTHFATSAWTYEADRGRFRNLLLKVATLKIHEVQREIRPLPASRIAPWPAVATEPEEIATGDGSLSLERIEQVRAALAVLALRPGSNPLHMLVFQLLLEGHGVAEVAARTGLASGNIHVIKHRMLRLLRTTIRQGGAGRRTGRDDAPRGRPGR